MSGHASSPPSVPSLAAWDPAVHVLEVGSSGLRLAILDALDAGGGDVSVGELCEFVGYSQSAISHHLRLMRMTGILDVERRGKANFYALTTKGVSLVDLARWLVQAARRDAEAVA
jgi:DNA-binding transcriptional ArsR family regulator